MRTYNNSTNLILIVTVVLVIKSEYKITGKKRNSLFSQTILVKTVAFKAIVYFHLLYIKY